MLVNTKNFVPPFYDGIETSDECGCSFAHINSIEEEYLNSIDRNIDDTPVVTNYSTLFSQQYKNELISIVNNRNGSSCGPYFNYI